MKRASVFAFAALVAALVLGSAPTAFAADQCVALGGAIVGTECQISAPVPRTGTFNLDETLHILGTGSIDASDVNEVGITLNICVAPAAPGACDLILDKPSVAGGGRIAANDTGASGNGGGPITINVSRDVLMQAGSAITANNTGDGGAAGNITITAGGNMMMCGPAGAQTGCGGASANVGARIAATNLPTTNNVGGNITITIGDVSKVAGKFYMEGGVTTYGAETGASIDATSAARRAGTVADPRVKSGDITIRPGGSYFTEPGSVVESGGHDASATQQGGKIYIVSGCQLTSEGRVTSKGPDYGADLVHLEGCEVIVRGLVESTGKGHVADAPNSCDLVDDGLLGEVLRDHPAASTGCVEVWGKVITIDSGLKDPSLPLGPRWAGELNADIGNGGSSGTSWIDIFASAKLTVIDGTGNDFSRNNLGHIYFSTYAVHANAVDGSDGNPGVVTAKVKDGPLTAGSAGETGVGGLDPGGRAFEASSTMSNDTGHGTQGLPSDPGPFVGNGSAGGTIDLEASGAVTLDDAFLNASGDFFGGSPCPSGSGACGNGGHIIVHAWGTGSGIDWMNGSGDVRTNDSGGSIVGGDITLAACGGLNTSGTDFHGEAPSTPIACDATKPEIPTIAAIDGGPVFKTDIWDLCGVSSISGHKFNDDTGNPIVGWPIRLYRPGGLPPLVTFTVAGGLYSFPNLPAGVYTICEQLIASTWEEVFPTSGPVCSATLEGPIGYTVDLTTGGCCAGQEIVNRDFRNVNNPPPPPPPPLDCVEDRGRTALLTRVVGLSAFDNGAGTPGNPKNYATIQLAYNAAANSGEVIGIFANTNENIVLGGTKTLTITQCTVARVTGAAGSPVWSLTSTGKLTVIGPDAVGGSIGWLVAGGGGHKLGSVRANGASQFGIKITSSNNGVSWNDVSGNGTNVATDGGIRVEGSTNGLKGGTVGSNKGDGVQLAGNSNELSGATITGNSGNGVNVTGSSNNVNSNSRINLSGKNGILVGGSSNTIQSNASESGKGNALSGINVTGNTNQLTDNKMNSNGTGFTIGGSGNKLKSNATTNNTGNEYTIGAGNTDQTGNKFNGTSFTFTAAAVNKN